MSETIKPGNDTVFMWYLYIVQCSDNSLYTGITKALDARLKLHNLGKAAKYTRVRKPVKLVYFQSELTESEARKLEIKIKKLPRQKKLELIQSGKTTHG